MSGLIVGIQSRTTAIGGGTQSVGTNVVGPTLLTIAPSGIASAEAFGSGGLIAGLFIAPSGITSAEAFGAASVADGSGPSITAAITSPTAGATLSEGSIYTITGTISVAGTVLVKLGSTVLGGASVSGLNWSFSYIPQNADIGAQTINATATATVGGASGNATGVAVTVAAAPSAQGFGALGEFAIGKVPAGGGILPKSVPVTSYTDSVAASAGASPLGSPPNNYTTGDSFRRVRITVQAGVTSLSVVAVPWSRTSPSANTIGVWVDDVYNTTLTYAGTQGVRAAQTLTLDGAAHTIDFEEQASLCDIVGTFTYLGYAQPDIRVVDVGDSITAATPASVPSKGYAPILRHQLPSNYQMTIWGQSGMTMVTRSADTAKIVSRLDGVTKNIVVIPLMINDFNNGVPLSNFTAATAAMIAGIHAGAPSAKILLVSSPQSAVAGGGGGTIQQYRDVLAAAAAANPSFVTYLDQSALYPGSSPWTSSTTDGVHPTDTAEPLWATSIGTAIQAL